MRWPTLEIVVALDYAVRQRDEWFDDPDDLYVVERRLLAVQRIDDPVAGAAELAYGIARDQAFGEGNKRTALLAARWVLDNNGVDGYKILPPGDRLVLELLVAAASGMNVRDEMVGLFGHRHHAPD